MNATRDSSIKSRPKWQLLAGLKRAGVTQRDIARRVGCAPSFVGQVLAKRAPATRQTPLSEAIWREVAKAIAAA